ncbi:hypothetical protein [Methylophilus sp. YYY-1]|uniref:hypothetical protein n=1 Tax=Methylophilus sp. YYY-1 TaxID=2682087 RepID=UPI0023B21616|nr:hypothetical protein [Methylophilus sp. YYY-1]MDF0379019.1 hypothetical protein [Methylophilus sp. YYY-1]
MIDNENLSQQKNLGEHQRIAGRDFNDHSVTHYADLKGFLLMINESELDKLSINNSDFFKSRFGKNLEKHWCEQIIDLKWEYGLTRFQTKVLLLVGAIRIDHKTNSVVFNHDKILYWYALLHIVMISLYSLAGSIVVLSSSASLSKQFFAQLAIAATWCITVWVFHIVFIYPYKLLKRMRPIIRND